MPDLPRLEVADLTAWRRWLRHHHGSSRGVWLVFFKGRGTTRGVSYSDALDEALCFGWIDSLIKRESDDTYLRKFTPRTNARKWSATNLRRARSLVRSGRMTEAGARVIGVSLAGHDRKPQQPRTTDEVPSFIQKALAARPEAAAFFAALAPSYRRRYLAWILSAKQEPTRARRLAEAVDLLQRGVKALLK